MKVEKYYYKDFLFDAMLFKDRHQMINMIPKTADFYDRFIMMLESLITDSPRQEKIYNSIEVVKRGEHYKTVKKAYSQIHFVYDSSIKTEIFTSYGIDEFSGISIEEKTGTVVFRYNKHVIDFLKEEMKDYEMDNPYEEHTFTHGGFLYCPSCRFCEMTYMKKLLLIFIFAILVFIIAGCSQGDSQSLEINKEESPYYQIDKKQEYAGELLSFQDQDFVDSFKESPFLKSMDEEYNCETINEAYITGHEPILKEFCGVIELKHQKILYFLALRNSYVGTPYFVLENFTISNDGYRYESKLVEKYPYEIEVLKEFHANSYQAGGFSDTILEAHIYAGDRIKNTLLSDYTEKKLWVEDEFEYFESDILYKYK